MTPCLKCKKKIRHSVNQIEIEKFFGRLRILEFEGILIDYFNSRCIGATPYFRPTKGMPMGFNGYCKHKMFRGRKLCVERLILISKLGTFKFEDNARFKLFLLSLTTMEYRRGVKLIHISA